MQRLIGFKKFFGRQQQQVYVNARSAWNFQKYRAISTGGGGSGSTTPSLPLKYVIKVHCARSPPDWVQPWQCLSQKNTVGSGLVIANRRILTNAHVVSDHSFVTVTKHNSSTHFPATISAIGHECDLALLNIEDPSFWEDMPGHLEFGGLPHLQDTVTVLGYPKGGESISVTRGVISRLEMVTYRHAGSDLLGIQIDAAINNGNSGGPALLGDIESFRKNPDAPQKVVGVAFQNMPRAENVGYIIPTPVINHFLGDIERFGQYKGFCRLGANYQVLTDTRCVHQFFGMHKKNTTQKLPEGNIHRYPNENVHAIQNVPNVQHAHDFGLTGVLITKVHPNTPAFGKLQKYDIVTHIDGRAISNEGMTKFQDDAFIGMEHWIADKYHGDTMELQVFREGKLQKIDITLRVCELLVPVHQFDKLTSYYIFGGCVFVPLVQPYLHTWGDHWYNDAPRDLLSSAMKGDVPDSERSQLIILSSVLPHTINMGCSHRCNTILERVGSVKIRSLAHLKQVIESRVLQGDELIDFYFREDTMMVLPVSPSLVSEMQILARHRISKRQSQELVEFNTPEFEKKMQNVYAATSSEKRIKPPTTTQKQKQNELLELEDVEVMQ